MIRTSLVKVLNHLVYSGAVIIKVPQTQLLLLLHVTWSSTSYLGFSLAWRHDGVLEGRTIQYGLLSLFLNGAHLVLFPHGDHRLA